MQRGSVLTKAVNVINGERQDTYGSPEDSFAIISGYWTTYLKDKLKPGVELDPKDSALMMVLFKIAREQNQGKKDNLVDAAGYIGIAGDMTPKPTLKQQEKCDPLLEVYLSSLEEHPVQPLMPVDRDGELFPFDRTYPGSIGDRRRRA